ncbi:GNAT family N-acetyltransferase [Photobacterium alginatilyticum]|uniref:N-acetyltransferase n=1 Tax=Photobacterium alginatilyticum TaxID=1775171 RepID=A0ABW9YB84_9GAMM|nr:GNAT family N-acetyltransferase [Photobacterium alginatilyticum]NBI51083.1 N-acetyltransferase [Photobacterium alginatilyticum]
MNTDFDISTPRLVLRPYKIVDLNELIDAVRSSVSELSPWLSWCTSDYDQHDAYEWINASRNNWQHNISYEMGIFERHSGLLAGSVSLNNVSITLNSAELGYWIRSSFHRQRFATEACQAISEFAFSTLGLTRLEIVTHTGNLASQRTALAIQAKFECTARNRIFAAGKPSDGLVFSLIPQDLHPAKPAFPTA